MKLFLISAYMLFVTIVLFAGDNPRPIPPIKNVEEAEDLRQTIRRVSENVLSRSGGDELFFRDLKNERIGIGTTTPEQKLHVVGGVVAVDSMTVTNLNSLLKYKVGTFTSSASTGNQAVTGVGFKPRFIRLVYSEGSAASSGVFWYSEGFGTSASSQVAAVTLFGQGDPPQMNGIAPVTNLIIRGVSSGATFLDGALVSMDDDGFTINWVTAQAETISYIAFQ